MGNSGEDLAETSARCFTGDDDRKVRLAGVLADQSQTEAVEIDLEEYVALDQRRGRQKSLRLRQRFVRLLVCCGGAKPLLRPQRLSAPIATERSRLNGFGGFLRT